MLLIELYFDEDGKIIEFVNDKRVEHLKICCYMLAIALNYKNEDVFYSTIFFL